jgi:MFS family permease
VTQRGRSPRPRLPHNVRALGAVSFFTDASGEMIYPLVPIFLSGVLGANAKFIGVIEGTAESVAALLRFFSGWWSDRMGRRKPLVVAGYGLASAARPLMALAQSASHVLMIRLTDRVGKGLRTAPRDALLAESVDASVRGRAFGFHHAADSAGAVVGPLAGFAILWWMGAGAIHAERLTAEHERALRTVFWIAAVPAVAAFLTLVLTVRDVRASSDVTRVTMDRRLPHPFWAYLAVVLLFTFSRATEAFLLLRATELGVAIAFAPLLWALVNFVKAAGSTAGGTLSDRVGRKPVILAGWVVHIAVYAAFAVSSRAWHVWALFALYGVFYALAEGPQRAFVADLVPIERRGAAYGWYYVTIALGALPASLLFGALWDAFTARAAFLTAAVLAALAAAALALLPKKLFSAGDFVRTAHAAAS